MVVLTKNLNNKYFSILDFLENETSEEHLSASETENL